MKVLPHSVANIGPGTESESDDLKAEGIKIIMPCNIIDIWTRLEN